METTNQVTINTFCQFHNVESQVIFTFQELGMVEIVEIESEYYLKEEKLSEVEQIIRLYKDLDLNPENVEVVLRLLTKIEILQKENRSLRRQLEERDF